MFRPLQQNCCVQSRRKTPDTVRRREAVIAEMPRVQELRVCGDDAQTTSHGTREGRHWSQLIERPFRSKRNSSPGWTNSSSATDGCVRNPFPHWPPRRRRRTSDVRQGTAAPVDTVPASPSASRTNHSTVRRNLVAPAPRHRTTCHTRPGGRSGKGSLCTAFCTRGFREDNRFRASRCLKQG